MEDNKLDMVRIEGFMSKLMRKLIYTHTHIQRAVFFWNPMPENLGS